jgi:hypothetical protein
LNWKKLFAVDFERWQKFFYFNNRLKIQKNKCFLFVGYRFLGGKRWQGERVVQAVFAVAICGAKT